MDIVLRRPRTDSKLTDAIALLVIWKESNETASPLNSQLKICLEVESPEAGRTER